ncbi:MAG: peptidase M14, partial [Gemmatimonadetes bacterium]|nr:peptidase M14 [Gemmatimonadota bacterium]
EARRLAKEGKAIVWIDGGLHATERAHGQMTPLLAYKVTAEETEEMRRIRDNVILLLMPNMNPDGLDIVTDWYRKNLGTPFENTSPPVLYHFYVGHDNNRDSHFMLQPETEAVQRVKWLEWYPQVTYNHHQSAPFPARIAIAPYDDPLNPDIPPLVARSLTEFGAHIGTRFAEEKKPGAVSRQVFSMWMPDAFRYADYFHNQVGLMSETGHSWPSPLYTDPKDIPEYFESRRGTPLSGRRPSVFYPDPWLGGWFRFRDAVDYMITASMGTLDMAAIQKEKWLYNIYWLGKEAIAKGQTGGPFAYVVPAEQWDRGEALELVRALRKGGVAIQRATAAFQADGKSYAAGSYVIFAGQPFRPWIMTLLEPQDHPDDRLWPGGPPNPPYDLAGWTMPLQMGVSVARIEKPFQASVQPVAEVKVAADPGQVTGEATFGYALSHRPNAAALATNRLLKAGERVSWAGGAFQAGGASLEAGTIVIEARGARTRERVEGLARELGLDFTGLAARPSAPLHPLRLPRVGLYKSWASNMDEGWTRWILERYEFPVDTLHDADVRMADLSRYDAIVIPDEQAQRILNGHAPGTMPAQYVGGMGVEGAARLKGYLERGGTIVALDGASDFAIEQFGLPLRNRVAGVPDTEFFIPGSLIRLETEPSHPLAYGMQREGAAFFVESRAFDIVPPARAGDRVGERSQVSVVSRYGTSDLLLSGWEVGAERYLAGRPAVVQARVGQGDVVLIAFRCQFRGQPRNTFKFLLNALHGSTLESFPASQAAQAGGDTR